VPLPLETARLLIRPFTLGDLGSYHERVRSDPEVMRYIPRPVAKTIEETASVLNAFIALHEETGVGPLAVTDKGSGEFIGVSGVFPVGLKGPEMEVAWILARHAWGRGYATEAGHACLVYGLKELEIPRIVALIFPDNAPSIRVAEKLGMACEGMVKQYDHEMLCYVATREMDRPSANKY
jgi:RimJ/RimL family protein N-acetyltransferase